MLRDISAMAPKRKLAYCNDDDNEAGPSINCSTCNSCHRSIDEHLMEENGRCSACNAKRQQQCAANIIDVLPQDVDNIVPMIEFIEFGISDMTPKRKYSTTNEDNAAGPSRKRCNYCFRERELVSFKPYCAKCAKDAMECTVCHRPLPVRLVEAGICNACRKKRHRNYRQGLGGAASIIDLTGDNIDDPLITMTNAKETAKEDIKTKLSEFNGIKWFISLLVTMQKLNREGEEITTTASFRGETETLLDEFDLDEQYNNQIDLIMRRLKDFIREGSGWSVKQVSSLELHIVSYKPISASSYIKTPKFIASKKTVINVQNQDNKCFIWSILAALHAPSRNATRINKYKSYENELHVTDLKFPLVIKDIKKFENLNQFISVNVLAFDGKTCIYPVYVTGDKNRKHHVNLLLISNNDKFHYVLIKNMSRLLCTNHNIGQKFFCNYCLHGFYKESSLLNHVDDCSKFGIQKVVLPDDEHKWVKFKSIQKMMPAPFVIYADFESFLCKVEGPKNMDSSLHVYERHIPSGFAYLIVSSDFNRTYEPVVYRGPDVIEEFLKRLKTESDNITTILSKVVPMKLSSEEEKMFFKTENCYLCGELLGADRVRDHDHLTGKFRGAAHNECNLKLQYRGSKHGIPSFYIPIVFHNLKGYDGHFILKGFKKNFFGKGNINCIPNNMERYLSFSIDNLRFIDSLQFMNASLDKLSSNLSFDEFIHIRRHSFPDGVHLLLRKGVFPYEYWDGPDKMNESHLPEKKAFFSNLSGDDISDEDYQHAQQVWRTFNLQTLGEYHDLYLKTDVLLLADVSENFRKVCLNNYHLDPAHYYSAPGLAWDGMLKMTNVRLELMQDRDMHVIVDKSIRGGICCISHKHAIANNPLLGESYDASKPNSYIMYLDMNNLYGTAMCEPLPERDFDFLLEDQIINFDVNTIPDDSPTGYILEVDIDYPSHLHGVHSDFPLCPQSLEVNPDDLSPYTKFLASKLGIKPGKCNKLIANLHSKGRYVLHYRNLKLYTRLGMVVTKIHRIISFTQSRWLKPYIDFNTEQRQKAANDFEKDFFKLMNNAVFGKTMENIRKHMDVKLVPDGRKFNRLTSKPNFKSFKIFSNDLVAVNMAKTKIKLIKPTYVGMSILDLSKTFMFAFHYDKIKQRYGDNAKLLMTDTDSLVYHIKTEDVYEDMLQEWDAYDTSEYPTSHKLFSVKNKRVLGKMKDEYKGSPIKEFIGLRPKMYSILEADGYEKKTAKGIAKRTSAKIHHARYLHTLYNEVSTSVTFNQIKSIMHEVFTVKATKAGLSPYDDKRYILDDGVSTLAFGHHRITNVETRSFPPLEVEKMDEKTD